ncbi:hypothetical protein BOSP111201_05615 [Bordetella sputigena]|uniref:hypothetical protein n=1 Tax=Bordetella sputigena TaxID=1416810 RepID=UPI0039F03EF5
MDYTTVSPEELERILNDEMRRHSFYNPGWGVRLVKVGGSYMLEPIDGASAQVINEALRAILKTHRMDFTVLPA